MIVSIMIRIIMEFIARLSLIEVRVILSIMTVSIMRVSIMTVSITTVA